MRDRGTHDHDVVTVLAERVAVIRDEQQRRAANVPASLVGSEQLTARQREVVALVVTGASNAEIAAELGTSSKTVRNHIAAVQRKTETRNRTHLAAVAGRAQVRSELALEPVALSG